MENIVTVRLKPIDKDNWERCAKLQVNEGQEDALPNNLFSIAELNFYPLTKAVAIVNESDLIVGFSTFGTPQGTNTLKIFRLMIDKKYQGKGYGKAALIKITKELLKNSDSNEIQVCYYPHMGILKRFYESIGFKEQGILPSERRKEGKRLAVLHRDDFYF